MVSHPMWPLIFGGQRCWCPRLGGVIITEQQVSQFVSHAREHARVVALPLRTRFRGIDVREAMLIPTPAGWVEFAPFVEYGPAEASRWLRSAIVHSLLSDANPSTPESTPERRRLQVEEGVRVPVNATMPAVDAVANPELVGELMGRYPGCTTVKVKVAEPSLEQDVARVRAVRRWFEEVGVESGFGAAPKIRVDANAGWTVPEAFDATARLAEDDVAGEWLDYVEQPCVTVEELAELRERLASAGIAPGGRPVRIAADELIRKVSDPLRVVEAGACDVAVVKVAPLGGIDQVVRVAEQVAEHGVSLTVSSALDTAVGIGAGLQAAALVAGIAGAAPNAEGDAGAAPNAADSSVGGAAESRPTMGVPNAAGLATGSLFAADAGRRQIVDGALTTGDVTIDEATLERYAVPAERRQWWVERMEAAARELV